MSPETMETMLLEQAAQIQSLKHQLERRTLRSRLGRLAASAKKHRGGMLKVGLFLAVAAVATICIYAATISDVPYEFAASTPISASQMNANFDTLYANDTAMSAQLFWAPATGGINYAGGNVGIGTGNPGCPLSVVGSSTGDVVKILNTNPEGYSLLSFYDSTTPTPVNRIAIGYANPSAGWAHARGKAYIAWEPNTDLQFYAGASLPTMLIQHGTGNVGIGVTNPGARLQVAGDILASGYTMSRPGDVTIGGVACFLMPDLATDNREFSILLGKSSSPGNSGELGYHYSTTTANNGIWFGSGETRLWSFENTNIGIQGYNDYSLPTSRFQIKGTTSDSSASSFNVANSVDASMLFVRNDGNIGIGTEDPKTRLHVVGLPVYDGNTSAKAGGLTNGAFYRDTTGALFVVF